LDARKMKKGASEREEGRTKDGQHAQTHVFQDAKIRGGGFLFVCEREERSPRFFVGVDGGDT